MGQEKVSIKAGKKISYLSLSQLQAEDPDSERERENQYPLSEMQQ